MILVFFTFGMDFEWIYAYVDSVLRNRALGLESLELRRWKCDLTMVYKIIHKDIALATEDFFELAPPGITRHRCFKLRINTTSIDVRGKSFACRVISAWNALPEYVSGKRQGHTVKEPLIRASNCRLFKLRLDKVDLVSILTKTSHGRLRLTS